MKTAIFTPISLLFIIALSFCGTPGDLLPTNEEVSGWIVDASTTCATGEVTTSQGLYDAIDGGAGTYIDKGFIQGAFQGYTDGTAAFCIEIYDQTTPANAIELYTATAIGEYRVLTDLGDSARVDTLGLFSNMMEFITGQYFVRIQLDTKDEGEITDGKALGNVIVQNATVAIERGQTTLSFSGSSMVLRSFPDPASQGIWFEYTGNAVDVVCHLYNVQGQRVQTLKAASGNKFYWNSVDLNGNAVSDGSYLAVVKTENKTITTKFTIRN
jgi:hypothetical protein